MATKKTAQKARQSTNAAPATKGTPPARRQRASPKVSGASWPGSAGTHDPAAIEREMYREHGKRVRAVIDAVRDEAIDAEFIDAVAVDDPGLARPTAAELSATRALVRATPSTALDIQRPSIERRPLFEMWLQGRKPRTIEAYRDDLKHFSRWLIATGTLRGDGADGREPGAPDAGRAIDFLVSLTHGEANELVLSYRGAQIEHGDAPASISRRLSAIRSLVKVANITGRITWLIGVEGVKHEKYRDTRGPDLDNVHKLFEAASAAAVDPYTAARDTAMLSLMFHRGLRRAEVTELRVEHVDLARKTLSIMGKGRTGRETLSLQEPLLKNLRVWLEERARTGQENDSLFDITGKGVWYVVKQIAKKAKIDVPVRPHGLRHAAVTTALDATNGNVREVAKFSRHKNIQTVTIYDDSRRDFGGKVAEQVAAEFTAAFERGRKK